MSIRDDLSSLARRAAFWALVAALAWYALRRLWPDIAAALKSATWDSIGLGIGPESGIGDPLGSGDRQADGNLEGENQAESPSGGEKWSRGGKTGGATGNVPIVELGPIGVVDVTPGDCKLPTELCRGRGGVKAVTVEYPGDPMTARYLETECNDGTKPPGGCFPPYARQGYTPNGDGRLI